MLFRRRKRALDALEQDVRDHLERETRDNVARGMTPDEARRQARLTFGNAALALEDARAVWAWTWLEQLRQDLAYALRVLRDNPGFSSVVILTMAIGVGAATAIASVADAILLEPLPLTQSDRLVRIAETTAPPAPGRPAWQRGVTFGQFVEWRGRTTTLAVPMGLSPSQALVKTSNGTLRMWGATTTTSTFTTLGIPALLGRTFVESDASNPDIVLLGFDAWRRFFQADPEIVGKTLEFQSAARPRPPMTVVGVLPAGVEFDGRENDFYTPFVSNPAQSLAGSMIILGHLRDGVTLEGARREANAIGDAIVPPPRSYPAGPVSTRFDVQPLKEYTVGELRPALRVFLAAVAVLLTIVCANVANLLLARGTSRQREMAVRAAIGASRSRILRQVVTECLVLAACGGLLGAALAAGAVTLVRELALIDAPGVFRLSLGAAILPRVHELGVDIELFGTAFAIAVVTSVAFGIPVALQLARPSPAAMGPRGGGAGRGASRLRAALVIGQLVMATVLLVGAGLLIHSFGRLTGVERGYDGANALAFQLVFPPDYPVARKVETIEAVLARLRALPGVTAAGFTRAGLLIGERITIGRFVPEGRTMDDATAPAVSPSLRPVSRGYLTAVGARVLEGRDMNASDEESPGGAIVISRSVTRLLAPGSPVGQLVTWHVGSHTPVQLRVVGVVEDLRNTSPDREPYPEVFVEYRFFLRLQQAWGESPLWQSERALGVTSLTIRTAGDPASSAPAVQRIVRSVDANAGIEAMVPLKRLVASSVARPRFYAVLLGVFAAVAVALAAIGVYGVLAFAVVQRTQEIGVRLALGAQRGHVLALVMRRGIVLTTAGIGLGLAAAAAGTSALQGMLFGITPLDSATFAAVAVTFAAVAAIACYLPARRAMNVDPVIALRSE